MFSNAATLGYTVSAVPHWTAGFSLPSRAVKNRKPSAVFLCLGSSVMGGRAGATVRLAGALPVRLTPVRSPTQLALGRRFVTATRANAMSSNTPVIRPHVEIVNGQSVTNSFKISEHFGKNHKDVLRAIDGLECSSDFRKRNFAPTSAPVPMPRGGHRYIPAYTITRDGFTFLAMGFTGAKAAQWKEAYIHAFNRMEATIKAEKPVPNPLGAFCHLNGPTEVLAGQRFLVSFSDDGTHYTAKPIPSDCCVMTPQQFLRALNEPNGIWIDSATLTEFVVSCVRRLERRASA